MIDREKVNKFLDVMDQLADEEVSLEITQDGKIDLRVYPKYWYFSGKQWSDDRRHEVLALCTPLVGRLNKEVSGTTIGYHGEKDDARVRLNYVDQCKIMGYKTVTKTVQKEVERPVEYETEEVEERVTITDCDIRTGKFSESDIEVPA